MDNLVLAMKLCDAKIVRSTSRTFSAPARQRRAHSDAHLCRRGLMASIHRRCHEKYTAICAMLCNAIFSGSWLGFCLPLDAQLYSSGEMEIGGADDVGTAIYWSSNEGTKRRRGTIAVGIDGKLHGR